MMGNVGQILCTLRLETGITQQSLCRGLMSEPEFSRVESGEKEADKFTLEAFFQRLGKSLDKLELTISAEEYEVIFKRTVIFECLEQKDFQRAKTLLEEYAQSACMEKILQQQYVLQMKALYVYLKNRDAGLCGELLDQALELTFPEGLETDLTKYRLCTQEIQLVLLRSYLLIEKKKWNMAQLVLEKLADYLEKYYTDEEERAKVYPQCMWLLAEVYVGEKRYEDACERCRAGIDSLAKNGALSSMTELLKTECVCLEYLDREKDKIQAERRLAEHRLEAIRYLYEIAEQDMPEEPVLILCMTSSQDEFVISNELILEQRIAKEMSQEELSEDICARETLSRIESGKRSPNRKNLHKMMQKLDLDRERYSGFVVADDYAVYEKVRAYNMARFWQKKEAALCTLEEIEKDLDMSIPMNRQYVEASRLGNEIGAGKISYEQGLEKLQNILRYTMQDFQGRVYRVPSRQECALLNGIAYCMRRMGRNKEAIDLYEQTIKRYESSRVLRKHHAVSEMLIYVNYPGVLEEDNQLERSEHEAKVGMRLTLECRRGNYAAHILANLSCVYEKGQSPQKEALCEGCLKNSYYLLGLYKLDRDSAVIGKYYEKLYGIHISDVL